MRCISNEKKKCILKILFPSCQEEFILTIRIDSKKNIINGTESPVIAYVFKDLGSLTDKEYARLLHDYELRKYVCIYTYICAYIEYYFTNFVIN